MMKKVDWVKATVILILFLMIIIYGSYQIYAMGNIIHNRSEDICNKDSCDFHSKLCPMCSDTNIYLLRRSGTHLPQFTAFPILTDLDTVSDQGVIKIIPHPPPAIL